MYLGKLKTGRNCMQVLKGKNITWGENNPVYIITSKKKYNSSQNKMNTITDTLGNAKKLRHNDM